MALTSHNKQIPLISGWRMDILIYYVTVVFVGLCYPFSTQEEGNKKEKGRKDEKRKEEVVAGEKEEERHWSMPEH